MSEHQHNGAAGWPPTLALQLDDACLRFEEAWKAAAGKRPRLEQYLASAPEPAREGLLHELLAVELAYRYREG